jgi:hypothetical protein
MVDLGDETARGRGRDGYVVLAQDASLAKTGNASSPA